MEMNDGEKVVLGCFTIILVLAVVVFMPFATLWGVYTIWDMPVESQVYDFYHWLAAFCVSGMFGGAVSAGIASLFKKY